MALIASIGAFFSFGFGAPILNSSKFFGFAPMSTDTGVKASHSEYSR